MLSKETFDEVTEILGFDVSMSLIQMHTLLMHIKPNSEDLEPHSKTFSTRVKDKFSRINYIQDSNFIMELLIRLENNAIVKSFNGLGGSKAETTLFIIKQLQSELGD